MEFSCYMLLSCCHIALKFTQHDLRFEVRLYYLQSGLKIFFFFQNNMLYFSYSIEMFKKECLPQPSLLLSQSLAPLSTILIVLVFMGLLSPKFLQAKVLLIERFYSDTAADRVQHLHAKIVRKRSKKKLRALKSTLVSYAKNVSLI